MASGYEKSEDYGGKPPSLGGIIIIILFWILLTALFLRYY
jgi:hypothetical protein